MGTQLLLPKRGQSPQFWALVYCCQTAGWIKMALGMKVGLGPRHVVLDGDPAPVPPKKGAKPNFRPMCIVAKQLDGSRCHLAGRQASAQATALDGTELPPKGGHNLNFWHMSIVAKRLDASVYHLLRRWPRPRRHCVRWGPAPPASERGTPPIFGPCLLWPNGRPSQPLLSSCCTAHGECR